MTRNTGSIPPSTGPLLPPEVCRGALVAVLLDGRAPSEGVMEMVLDRLTAQNATARGDGM